MIRRPYIIIQSDDIKSRLWREAAEHEGVDIVMASGSPMYMPVHLLRNVRKRGIPKALVFRYLNDYRPLWRTMLRAASEASTLMLCALLGVRVIWICHNVDRESALNHPWISRLRRLMIGKRAAAVLVTDQHLVEFAREHLLPRPKVVGYVTFGEYIRRSDAREAEEFTELVRSAVGEWKQKDPRAIVGLCAGSPSWKMAHYAFVPDLIRAAESVGLQIRMIVAGPVEEFLQRNAPGVLRFFQTDGRVRFRSGYVPIKEHDIASYIDFYWKVYSDYSVPMSIYAAASVGRPVLTLNMGFLGLMVRKYQLGEVIERDFSNIASAFAALSEWDPRHAREFLHANSWTCGAKSLIVASGLSGMRLPEALPALSGDDVR